MVQSIMKSHTIELDDDVLYWMLLHNFNKWEPHMKQEIYIDVSTHNNNNKFQARYVFEAWYPT